jgi:hypothetical protein
VSEIDISTGRQPVTYLKRIIGKMQFQDADLGNCSSLQLLVGRRSREVPVPGTPSMTFAVTPAIPKRHPGARRRPSGGLLGTASPETHRDVTSFNYGLSLLYFTLHWGVPHLAGGPWGGPPMLTRCVNWSLSLLDRLLSSVKCTPHFCDRRRSEALQPA